MEYISILRGINNLDKPVQNFHRTVWEAEKWAAATLIGHPATGENPDPNVEIFEVKRVLVKTVRAAEKK